MSERFGRYEVKKKIATGGMAEVYLARETGIAGFERTVVLKRILPEHRKNEDFVGMFLDEARLLGALSHPNIAQVFDVGEIDGAYYLVMEYVRGATLRTLIDRATRRGMRGLPEKEALGIALQLAEALSYVHSRRDDNGRPLRIVHRDLNPANVIVSYDGAVKLIDFGIAKAASRRHETRVGIVKGTYGYMAPEQLTADVPLDLRADVFTLGIVLYEMCTGEHPFDGSDLVSMLTRMLQGDYAKPSTVVLTFPLQLERLIRKCLAGDPMRRPADVGELIHGISQYLESRKLAPTMHDVADLVQTLSPDAEGASPLKPMSTTRLQRPFGADEMAELANVQPIVDPALDVPLDLPDAGSEDDLKSSRRWRSFVVGLFFALVLIGVPGYIVWQALQQTSRPLPQALERFRGAGVTSSEADAGAETAPPDGG